MVRETGGGATGLDVNGAPATVAADAETALFHGPGVRVRGLALTAGPIVAAMELSA